MKIRISKDIVEITPGHAAEKSEPEALWVKMCNCTGGNKNLVPLGMYVPSENKTATFRIEGLTEEESNKVPEIRAPYNTDVYCVTCNKAQHVKSSSAAGRFWTKGYKVMKRGTGISRSSFCVIPALSSIIYLARIRAGAASGFTNFSLQFPQNLVYCQTVRL